MVSDVPIGAMFSGGLDSSTVVAMMRKVQPDSRPQCYTIAFEDGQGVDGDPADLVYARKVAKHLDVDLHPIVVGPDAIQQLERMLYYLDEPQADPAPINSLIIAERARADGVKVLLSGTGGDDIFSGYRRHQAIQLEKAWSWMPSIARRGLSFAAERSNGSGVRSRRFHKAFANAHLSPKQRMISYFQWNDQRLRRNLLSAEVLSAIDGSDASTPLGDSLDRISSREKDPLNQVLYLEAKHFLADHNLNYLDKTGMASGVEIRVPLLDLDLIRFAAAVPSKLKLKGTTTKYILKKAVEPYLPHDAIYRPKTGFGMPLRRWLHNELRETVEDVLSESSLASRGLFNGKAVRNLLERDRRGQIDGAYTIFSLLCIELWCRIFLDSSITVDTAHIPH
jgi:asparagine synthase (glutamine-hydrolysing)